ncbi:hypothetical protein [Halorussus marinus]|uniref:hypothetical protein n=1 Tax=Halorussus marinus TaxID=2505976 RepID=UPI00106ED7E0|nr:hypothetical protein [Halorussus marinus]
MNSLGGERSASPDETAVGTLSFEVDAGDCGVTVVDSIERHRYSVETSRPVAPTPVDVDDFLFPADAGVAITTESLTLPTVVPVYVRDQTGDMLAEAEHFADEAFDEGVYSIELNAPIKLYLNVSGPLAVTSDMEHMQFEFGSETEVLLGARSHHEHPAATVTTTADPTDMMAAVSTFGSALKTTSCERSYPTLRGHPPTIELGDQLEIPDELTVPDTGIRIEIPSTYRAVYVAAPLAYYLGATVVEGDRPRVVTETGFEHPLDTERGVEAEAERLLKQTFFLDCLTRTEGYYQVDLHERGAIEPRVDLDFERLYEQSPAEQLEAYLTVPFSVVEPEIPEWKLTSHVEPVATSIETLPFVVEDLAVVHTPKEREPADATQEAAAVEDFFRTGATDEAAEFTRSTDRTTPTDESYVQPESADSLEQTWVGDGTPIGASKATTAAFRNHLNRTPTEGDIEITVVCNDRQMNEERDAVDAGYGSRETLPFDVTVHHDLTTTELRDVLARQTDFLHYIGHIDGGGFECADGKFDATTLDSVGVDAFLLNACQSYAQGMHLLEAGSIAGVVTLSDVINTGAVRVGRTMARLLNAGFPLRAALTIARNESIVGGKYIVVGDGGLSIAQAESGTPNLCEIERDGDAFTLRMETYPTAQTAMGTLIIPYIEQNETHFLTSGVDEEFSMGEDELRRFLSLEEVPIRFDGELRWSTDLSVEQL